MSNYNKVLLMGRLTRDPELRYIPSGVPVTDIGIAINREFSAQGEGQGGGGDRRKETTFVDVTIWRRRAEVICQYLKKGDPIFIEGRLTLDTWEAQDGQKRSKLKVVADNFQFISTGRGGGGGGGDYGGDAAAAAPPAASGGGGYTDYEYQGTPYSQPAPAPSPPAPSPPAPPAPASPEPQWGGGGGGDQGGGTQDGDEPLSDKDIPF